jgi:hypothetical protein
MARDPASCAESSKSRRRSVSGALSGRLERLPVTEHWERSDWLCRPARGIRDDASHVRMEVGWVGLVTGAEVEDPAAPALIATAAAEHLTALEPAHEHESVWRRDIEVLSVHFLVLDQK